MKNKIILMFAALLFSVQAHAAQHDYVISNAPGATVRSDINNVLTAIANNNSGATEPATMYANMWWFDTSSNLLKQRDNANSAWITTASRSGTNWIPYRNGSPIGTAALLTTDTDTGLAANSDSNAATQKAVKAYADGKISKTTAGEINAMSEKTTLVADDLFLIEDSAASHAKKKVKKSNLSNPTSQVFTGNGTFTAPTGVTRILVTMCGGGGGGGGSNTLFAGGGGGAGQSIIAHSMVVSPGAGYTVTVGSGGAGGNAADGSAGGNSTFVGTTSPSNYTLTTLGGDFGEFDNDVDSPGGSATASATTLNASGTTSGNIYIYGGGAGANSSASTGGAGGSSMLGKGGASEAGIVTNGALFPGGTCAGGGGAARYSSTGGVGGNGGGGEVRIEW